jgi:hypothetical protein
MKDNQSSKKRHPAERNDSVSESDLANERMGNNQLRGNDQENVRNQRHAVPDVKLETDSIEESFEKLDKEKRAREDLGKGRRSGGR